MSDKVASASEHMDANQRHWDSVVSVHTESEFYDVASFRAGRSKLKPVELAELGDVRGKTLLHLQCHFGMDTLSWARNEGALVTGADFSLNAIEEARGLAAQLGIDARFVQSNVYDLPQNLEGQFDVVFTSYGVLGWLPDLERWAQVAAHFVKPGGTFYIVEFHPFSQVFDESAVDDLHVRYPYFETGEPLLDDSGQDYANPEATFEHRVTYWFPHPLADVVTSLIDAGLRIEFLHEFPFSTYQFLPITHRLADGTVRLLKHDGCVPLLYSIKATKPA